MAGRFLRSFQNKNLKKKLKTQEKNSKLKGKTQFSGIYEANKVSQSALKKPGLDMKKEVGRCLRRMLDEHRH